VAGTDKDKVALLDPSKAMIDEPKVLLSNCKFKVPGGGEMMDVDGCFIPK